MSTNRRRGLHADLRTAQPEKRPNIDKYPSRRFPIQNEIRKLEDELNAFNERIAELEDEGHRGHAMEVLKAHAIDFARQIDELRCLLVTHHDRSPVLKKEPKWQRIKK
jgi:hypothetical protein